MKNTVKTAISITFLSIACAQSKIALADETFSLTSGIDYSSGKYGQSQSTSITYIPFTAKYTTEASSVKLTVPWLQITGPGDVIGANADLVSPNSNRQVTTESGLGDVILSGTHTVANIGKIHPLTIDLTGKVKFATASTSKRLGTGENDYSVNLDAYQAVSNSATLFGTIGYKKMGDPAGISLNNVWLCSTGLSYKISPISSLGIMGDFRQKTLDTSAPLREVTAFFAYKLSAEYKLQSYISHGYSDASTGWGGGLMLNKSF
jgi:hypothetical protein